MMGRISMPFPVEKKHIKNILVMKPYGGLGDLLLSTPVIHSLKMEFPDATMTVMAKETFADILEGNPYIDWVVPVPYAWTNGFSKFGEQLRAIRNGNFDLALVLWTSFREALLLLLAGIPYRVGQSGRLLYSFMFSHQVDKRSEEGDEETHQVEILLDNVRSLGFEPKNKEVIIKVSDEATSYVDKLLYDTCMLHDEFFIGFNITKGMPVTRDQWPIKKFQSFARALSARFNAPVVFTGTESEKGVIDAVLEKLKGPYFSIAGKTDLRQLAAFIKRCGLFVSPDSGPMHMAAALKVPVVGIYGLKCDYPKRWAPWTPDSRIVRIPKIPCEYECIKETCPNFICYEAIPDDMLVNAAENLIVSIKRKT
jgi:lipopolysaccharide heptosyltransferase II